MPELAPKTLSDKEQALKRFSEKAIRILEKDPSIPELALLQADLIGKRAKFLDDPEVLTPAYNEISDKLFAVAEEKYGIDRERLEELANLAEMQFGQGSDVSGVIKFLDEELIAKHEPELRADDTTMREYNPEEVTGIFERVRGAETEEELDSILARFGPAISPDRLSEFDEALRVQRAMLSDYTPEDLEVMKDYVDIENEANRKSEELTYMSLPQEDLEYLEELVAVGIKQEAEESPVTPTLGQEELIKQSIAEALSIPEEGGKATSEILRAAGPLILKLVRGNRIGDAEDERVSALVKDTLEETLASGIDAKIRENNMVELRFAECLKDILPERDTHLADELSSAATELVYTPSEWASEDADAREKARYNIVLEKYEGALARVRKALESKWDKPNIFLEEIDRRVRLAQVTQAEGVAEELAAIKDPNYHEELEQSRPWFGLGTMHRSFLGKAVELANSRQFKHLIRKAVAPLSFLAMLSVGSDLDHQEQKSNPLNTKVSIAEVVNQNDNEVPLSANELTEVIGEGDSAWRAANRIGKQLGMSRIEFSKAWFDPRSQIEFKDGTCFHVSHGNLTYPGDALFYIEGNENRKGYFKVATHVRSLKSD